MTHRWYKSLLLFAVLAILPIRSTPAQAADHPNIVIILADDQGWGDLSVHGNGNLQTPHIDSLARDGAMFERFYVCPVCSPTRAEFLTGRYHLRGGVYSTSTGGERLNLDETTIGDAFKAAGYATGAFGKWHNGMQYPYHPNGRGFDEYYGFCSGHWGNYFDPVLEHNGKLVRGKGFIIDDLTDHAMSFIEANREKPFFCYLPLCTPHSPMQVPDRFYEKFADLELKQRHRDAKIEDVPKTRAALAMCENIDWNVGRVLSKLDELKLADDTIVIYFSDNGPNSWRWNDGMKGRKGSTDEGGVRSPLLVRWPGRIAAGTKVKRIGGAIDLLPTLVDLSGIDFEPPKPLDGISLRPVLTEEGTLPHHPILSHWNGKVSVRIDGFVYDNEGRLFQLEHDPGQRKPLKEVTYAAIFQMMEMYSEKWKKELLPGYRDDDRPFPVGYSEFPITHLPARDGVPHGNVKRSARAPNCSFFTNWTSTDDRITWDVEVATAGRYEATVYYTCAKENVGSTFELSLNDSRIQGKVTEAHDPPLHGKENDRTSRGSESYVKDFKPMTLGVVELKKGRGQLTLRAMEIPGKQVMDVRYVVLTLQ